MTTNTLHVQTFKTLVIKHKLLQTFKTLVIKHKLLQTLTLTLALIHFSSYIKS